VHQTRFRKWLLFYRNALSDFSSYEPQIDAELSLGFVRTHESEHVRTLDILPAQLAKAILDVADTQLKHLDGLGVAHRDNLGALWKR
jgi:hypothetical protein